MRGNSKQNTKRNTADNSEINNTDNVDDTDIIGNTNTERKTDTLDTANKIGSFNTVDNTDIAGSTDTADSINTLDNTNTESSTDTLDNNTAGSIDMAGGANGVSGGGLVAVGARRIAVTAVMTVLLVAGKFVIAGLANVEVVTTLVVCFSLMFGFRRTFLAVNAFVLLDIPIYGFSPAVTASYLLHWNAIVVITCGYYRLTRSKELLPYLIIATLVTLSFGFNTTLFESLFFGFDYWQRYFLGLTFYAVQLASTLVFMCVGFPLLLRLKAPDN